jgi:hypothetical protein
VREARAFSGSFEPACGYIDMCLLRDTGALWELFDRNGYAEVRRKLLGAPAG